MTRLTKTGTNTEHLQPLRDLVALVERYSGQGRRAGNSFTYRCPNPQHPDNTPSFTVTRDKRGTWRASCWSQCQFRGDALDLVCWLDGCTKAQGADKLRAFMGLPAREIWVPPVQKRPAAQPAPKALQPLTARHHKTQKPNADTCQKVLNSYLTFRGWPEWVVSQFGLSVVADDRGLVRVRHPFYAHTAEGCQPVAFQDRATGQALPKWKGPQGVPLPLYNGHTLTDEVRAVLICEGPADTISACVAVKNHPGVTAVGVAGVNAWRTEWAHLFTGRMVVTVADSDTAGGTLRDRVEDDLTPITKSLLHLLLPTEVNDLTDYCKQYGYELVGDNLSALFWLPLLSEFGLTAEVVS